MRQKNQFLMIFRKARNFLITIKKLKQIICLLECCYIKK